MNKPSLVHRQLQYFFCLFVFNAVIINDRYTHSSLSLTHKVSHDVLLPLMLLAKLIETEGRMVIAKGWGEWRNRGVAVRQG